MKNVTDKADATAVMGKDKAFHQETKWRQCAKQRKKRKKYSQLIQKGKQMCGSLQRNLELL